MANGKCPYHQDIEHTVGRLESRMTRLELGIVGLFGTIIIMLGSTLWAMLDLPERLSSNHENGIEQALRDMEARQNVILRKLGLNEPEDK